MATRAAIAAKDRDSREKIAREDRAEKKRQFDKSHKLERTRASYQNIKDAAGATESLIKGAYGKGGLISAMNDPSWYKKFNLNSYSTKLPTFYRLGSQLYSEWLNNTTYDVVPGIATGVYVPTLPNQVPTAVLGNDAYKDSPINKSLTRFMAKMRSLNSRVGEYDPSDIGLYWYAIIGVMIPILELCKAIKAYNTYYAESVYLARGFIESCGFTYTDFVDNVQQYKALAIRLIDQFNENAVIPQSLDFVKRYAWLASCVVRDHGGKQSQLYHFRCGVNLSLTDDESYVSVSALAARYTYASFVSNVESKVTRLFNSTGVVTMTADLRAAFKDGVLLKIPQIDGSEELQYSESEHDLEQIHNARTLPVTTVSGDVTNPTYNAFMGSVSRMNIIVSTDGYLAQGAFNASNQLLPIVYSDSSSYDAYLAKTTSSVDQANQFMNFYDEKEISDDSILESTRFRYTFHRYLASFSGYAFKENGTEILVFFELTRHDTQNIFSVNNISTDYVANFANVALATLYLFAEALTFDWFPWLRCVSNDGDSDAIFTLGEMDHCITLSAKNLRILHEGCTLSLFYVDDFSANKVA